MTTVILLPRGHRLLVDDADVLALAEHKWHAFPARGTFYAQAGDDTSLTVHRLLMKPGRGLVVDHVNRNGLDNRRVNLRSATHSQNHANRPAPRSNTSGYKGVSRTAEGRWSARITVDYQQRYLGTFVDPWDAAEAYNAAAFQAWGDFALLNEHRPQAAHDPDPVTPGPAADASHTG